MRREYSKLAWRRINRVTRPPTGRSCLQAQEIVNGRTITHTDRAGVEGAIQRECESRFRLGHSAPISRSLLGEEVGYLTDSAIALEIISGTYKIPPNMEEGTALLLTEIGKVGIEVQRRGPPVEVLVSASDYQKYYSRLNENTSSAFSGFHLGHHMSIAKSDDLSSLLANQMNLIISSGVCPSRWGTALQVLLEKVAGVCLVTKLRSIQLYEGDYNWFNKVIFNDHALATLNSTGFMPEEHFSQKQSMAEDACFDKVLTLGLSRQSRLPMALVSIDVAQCYDRVNHLMMSLVWLALGVPRSAIAIILSCLAYMKIYTRTGFGDSSSYFGGPDQPIPFCGLGQGSKAAPASWLQLSTMIINSYRAQGFAAEFRDPVTRVSSSSVGCVYVDDTDIYTAGPTLTTPLQIIQQTCRAVPLWSLSATGGAIKGSKSGWYLISYVCENGIWAEKEVPWDLVIPLPAPEGDTTIVHHEMSYASKSLGVFTSPSGGHAEHLRYIRDRVAEWLSLMRNGHLNASLAWMSYQHQLWAGVRYGLGTLTNDISAGRKCLDEMDIQMLSFLGINRNIKKGWRRLPHTFGGAGLLDLTIEQHICRVNLFCQHYGSSSTIGLKLSASLHWLQLQAGCSGNPLLLDYTSWEHLATSSWIKSFWEALHTFPGDLSIKFDGVPLQREHDRTLMEVARNFGLQGDELASFNRCRCASKLLFLSDVTTASGDKLEHWMHNGSKTILDSDLDFPPEYPTDKDWQRWTQFWRSTYYSMPLNLGGWVHRPHFRWQWWYCADSGTLLKSALQGWHVYKRVAQRTRLTSEYVCTSFTQSLSTALPASIQTAFRDGRQTILAPQTGPFLLEAVPAAKSMWDLLLSWGGEWMLTSIFLPTGDPDLSWLVSGIQSGTVIGCTDGSFDGKKSSRLCSSGWILHDNATKRRLAGSFCEDSPGAGSYRGEVLGLCALQLLLLAIEEWYGLDDSPLLNIYCDNEKAGERAQEENRRIKPSWSSADVLRSFRNTKQHLSTPVKFLHVSAHMDDLMEWDQLSLPEQLNCMCDALAKEALALGIRNNYHNESNMLPRELSAVFFSIGKATSDPAEHLRFALG